ncbi:unnamed protein product, partial [Pleuronectes platessa]
VTSDLRVSDHPLGRHVQVRRTCDRKLYSVRVCGDKCIESSLTWGQRSLETEYTLANVVRVQACSSKPCWTEFSDDDVHPTHLPIAALDASLPSREGWRSRTDFSFRVLDHNNSENGEKAPRIPVQRVPGTQHSLHPRTTLSTVPARHVHSVLGFSRTSPAATRYCLSFLPESSCSFYIASRLGYSRTIHLHPPYASQRARHVASMQALSKVGFHAKIRR